VTPGAPILTVAAMRAAEQSLFDAGMPEYALMERAGAAATQIIWRAGGLRDALIICGPGNNGGDGYVIARLLKEQGVPVRVAAAGEPRSDSARQARINWSGPVEDVMTAAPAGQLVDALFGTGQSRGLDARLADRLNELAGAATISYAIDLPSGVDSDSGALLSPIPSYGVCIAIGALKPAHLLHPSAGKIGRLVCADIGIDADSAVRRLPAPMLTGPGAADHKYSRGLVSVIGGAMAGASLLAAQAAARSGAGMVRRIAADALRHGADAIVTQQADTAAGLEMHLQDRRISALLVGPGLGLDADATARLDAALKSGHPLVLDADALTLLGQRGVSAIPPGSILTPHEGEFVRLFGHLPGSKIDRALAAAALANSVLIYKGADSVIASPDGRALVAGHGSFWLSTAGTGDVLAGLVAGRLAVTGDAFRAAAEALWLHGDVARRCGPAFVADDLPVALPQAIAARL
jgi:hydroxyethylthiazole kinase-like uncharacterized protein yjeF